VRSIIMRFVCGLRMIVVLFCRWRLVMLPTLALRHALTASDEPPACFLGSLSQHSCILLAPESRACRITRASAYRLRALTGGAGQSSARRYCSACGPPTARARLLCVSALALQQQVSRRSHEEVQSPTSAPRCTK
jgi:hypothetical protein